MTKLFCSSLFMIFITFLSTKGLILATQIVRKFLCKQGCLKMLVHSMVMMQWKSGVRSFLILPDLGNDGFNIVMVYSVISMEISHDQTDTHMEVKEVSNKSSWQLEYISIYMAKFGLEQCINGKLILHNVVLYVGIGTIWMGYKAAWCGDKRQLYQGPLLG